MKIQCECGVLVYDGTDGLSHKAHVVPDRLIEQVWDAADFAIEKSGPSPKEKEAACMKFRSVLGSSSRLAYQCSNCGRLFVYDSSRHLHTFVPASPEVSKDVFNA